MTEDERLKKRQIFNKITELVKVASALGDAIEDEQTIFLAETIKLVLVAGSNPDDCSKFSEHCLNYINEKLMEEGELEVNRHLMENVYMSNN